MRVLLADDSQLILDRMRELFEHYKQIEIVGTTLNGDDTLIALKNLKPDLAIIDLNLPGLSGLDILNEIRNENRPFKIIILTFYSTDYYRKKAMALGADYFFSKVDDIDKLLDVVNEMITLENA